MPEEREIFDAARCLDEPAARAAYLSEACGTDVSLHERVQALLQVHDQEKSFLAAPTVTAGPPLMFTAPGTIIGRYKILEPIGEGGYGTVFMAEQTTPVHRKVALKIIKAGMDTRQVIARFEAERQALALMDHPNIAKVFDAGVTEQGRPYFVMELVKGAPITRYCDEHRLSPRARLELFIQVCQAVQHAHQKGIIHRDLKPTNVLVAQYDGKPVPKVIDFGVAKATGQRLTEATMFTGFGDVIGTPQYMSPEQAELNQLDVDTRSDIYSLGVLLYELLTGTTPLEAKHVREVALLEVLRVIREEEPPRPSTRLTSTAELPSIAAQRGIEPKKLSGIVRGELDWIVMRALEKDRSRRYETANGLAMDVQRYLNDEAVHACPPSTTYRLKKVIRRHKVGVLAGTGILAALMIGLVVASISLLESRRQARIARAEVARADFALAMMFNGEGRGNSDAARAYARAGMAKQKQLFADDHPEMSGAYHVLSMVLGKSNPEEAIDLERKAIAILRKQPTEPGRRNELAFSLDNLAGILVRQGEVTEPEGIYRESLPLFRSFLGNDHVYVANTLEHLGALLVKQGKHAEAENHFRECLAIRRRVSGEKHSSTIKALNSLIEVLKNEGKDAEAETVRRDANEPTTVAAPNPTTQPQPK